MYTFEQDEAAYGPGYAILDSDGDMICMVPNEWQARDLLSHLNR